jgi:hypothetical protein
MDKPKGVTIKLTDKQRSQIKTAIGKDHSEIRVETLGGVGQQLGTKAAAKLPAKAAAKAAAKLPAKAAAKLPAKAAAKAAAKLPAKAAAKAAAKVAAANKSL